MASSTFICVIIFSQFFATTSGLDVFNYTMCKAQHFSADSFVCTCTDIYCDGFSAEGLSLPSDSYAVYTSSKDGARFELNVGNISSKPEVNEDTVVLELNSSKKFQEVLGFGGAFTGIGGDMIGDVRDDDDDDDDDNDYDYDDVDDDNDDDYNDDYDDTDDDEDYYYDYDDDDDDDK